MRHSFEVDQEAGAGDRRGGPSAPRRLLQFAAVGAASVVAVAGLRRFARREEVPWADDPPETDAKAEAEMVASSLLTEPPSSCSELAQNAQDSHLIGAFVPQCQEDGAFAARQCHGSTGYCWCSSATGRKVPETLRGPSEGGSLSEEDCVAERQKEEEEKKQAAELVASSLLTEPPSSCSELAQNARDSHLIGAFVPQCQEDGAFAARQCHGSTGYCWCSSALGRKLRSTTEGGDVSEEECAAVRNAEEDDAEGDQEEEEEEEEEPSSSCSELAQKALDRHLIGAYVPQCQEDGAFAARQCHGSTGYCWCSSASGRKVPGTLRSPTADVGSFSEEDCAAARSLGAPPCPCQAALEEAEAKGRGGDGSSPRCEGCAFAALQCSDSDSSLHCWCADPNGKELPGLSADPSQLTREDCVLERHLVNPRTTCEVRRAEAPVTPAADQVARCEPDGSFSALQCPVSALQCYCVAANGEEIQGTRGALSSQACESQRELPGRARTPCEKQRADALGAGARAPACSADGAYAARQCDEAAGSSCWCVDHVGSELPGTRTGDGAGSWSLEHGVCDSLRGQCKALMRGACASPPDGVGNCMLHMQRYHFNATSRRCEEYTMAGCHGSANDFATQELCLAGCGAWSASPEGLPAHAMGGRPTCQESLEAAQRLEGRGLLGVFHPRCTEELEWQAMQCHKYGCWCVDESGSSYSGMRLSTVGSEGGSMEQFQSSCESLRRTCKPCQLASQEKCTEQHQAQGLNCIVGACVEGVDLHAAVDK